MNDRPVDLDEHRGMAGKKATRDRREQLTRFQDDQAAVLVRQNEMENFLLAQSAETWPEAAAKARYLIQLFADTPEAQDPRRKLIITTTLEDLERLCAHSKDKT
jgi:hypothetical protein